MAPSLPAVPLLLALVLGIALPAQAYDQLDYCQPPKICPQFTRIATNEMYEERLYESSVWMCTVGDATDPIAAMKATMAVINYRNQQSWLQVVKIDDNTWPSLVKVKQGEKGQEFSLCWLVPPGVTLSSSGQVTVETLLMATMFVRSFEGNPSFRSSQENAQKLMQDLADEGECFNRAVFYAANYDKDISVTHHNEIWVPQD
uniref:Heme-binding protein 2 n=1 Tax=Neogobius melanostomus TaxID=47308 RepID=A0A8C6WHN6_9GOBI